MVTTRSGSSASPPDGTGDPAVPPDRVGSPTAPQGRAATPPGMIGIVSAPIPDESDILKYVVANVLKQPSDSPLVPTLDAAGINEITDLLTLDHQSRNALMYELDDGTAKPLPLSYKNLLRVLKIFTDDCQDNSMPIEDWTTVPRETLTSSGPVMLDWLFQRRAMHSLAQLPVLSLPPLLLLHLLSRKISLLNSRKGSRWC